MDNAEDALEGAETMDTQDTRAAFEQALEEVERAVRAFDGTFADCDLSFASADELKRYGDRLELIDPHQVRYHVRMSESQAWHRELLRAAYARYGYLFPEKDSLTNYDADWAEGFEHGFVHGVYERFLEDHETLLHAIIKNRLKPITDEEIVQLWETPLDKRP